MVGQEMLTFFFLQIWEHQIFWDHNMCTQKIHHYPVRQTVLLYHKTTGLPAPGCQGWWTCQQLLFWKVPHSGFLAACALSISVLTKEVSEVLGYSQWPLPPATNNMKKIDDQRTVSGLNLWVLLNAHDWWERAKSKCKLFQLVIPKEPLLLFSLFFLITTLSILAQLLIKCSKYLLTEKHKQKENMSWMKNEILFINTCIIHTL